MVNPAGRGRAGGTWPRAEGTEARRHRRNFASGTGLETRDGGSTEGRVMARFGLARVPVQYVAQPATPEPRPQSAAPADETLALALQRLNQSLELEVAVLRLQRDVERVRAIAGLWNLAS